MITSACLIRNVLFSLLMVLVLASLSCETKKANPILGIDPIHDVALLEDHSEALARWAEMGIRNATVINIDAHDDIRWIREDKIEELHKLYINKDWNSIRESRRSGDGRLFNVGNFLYASAKLGIVSEVYWIIPFGHFSEQPSEKRLKIFLKSFGFEDKEIKTFHIDSGCFRGDFNGVPLAVCGIESLPNIDKPLILNVDSDFFAPMAFDYGVTKLDGLRMLYEKLFKMQYKILDAVVSYSVNGGYTRVIHRWVGEQAAKIIGNPTIIYEGRPPDLWTVRQKIETLYRRASIEENLSYLMPLIEKYPDEPSILTYAAHILYETDSKDEMYHHAEKACMVDRNYCHGLIEIGKNLLKDGKFDEANKFFKNGYRLNPDMNYLQKDYGIALMKKGLYKEALEYFKIARQMNGPLPYAFHMGKAYLSLGNKESALKHFDTARKEMALRRYIEASKKSDVDVIVSAIKFYEKNGYMKEASELKNNPKLKTILTKKLKHSMEGK